MTRVRQRRASLTFVGVAFAALACGRESPGALAASPATEGGDLDAAPGTDTSPKPPSAARPDVPDGAGEPSQVPPLLELRKRPALTGTVRELRKTGELREATPPDYRLDGDVSEWSRLPATSTAAEAGRARMWFVMTPGGFGAAGAVETAAATGAFEHVRINVAFEPPTLPPIAFVNHLDAAIVDETWCRTQGSTFPGLEPDAGGPSVESQAECLAWLAKCKDLRSRIAERFERVIDIDLRSSRIAGAAGARVAVRRNEAGTGAGFEVEVPLTSMPETSEMPLRTLRIAARVLSTTLTPDASASRKDVPPWDVFLRKDALRLHRADALVEHVLAEARAKASKSPAADEGILDVAASYVPAPTSTRVSYLFNVGQAGQWSPDANTMSPQVGELDVAKGRTLFTLRACSPVARLPEAGAACAPSGDIAIEAHPSLYDDTYGTRHPMVALVSRLGDAVLDVSASTSFDPYAVVQRAPGAHILDVYQGPGGPYGSGPSGLQTGYRFELVTMDASGRFSAPRSFDLSIWRGQILGVDGLPGFDSQTGTSDAHVWVGRSLDGFGLKGTFFSEGPSDPDADFRWFERAFEAGYRWDPHKGDYVQFGSARPLGDAGGG